MKNLNKQFTTLHEPVKALMFYRSNANEQDYFVESFDINNHGRMVDPHPLSLQESQKLAETLLTTVRLSDHYLQSEGFFPSQVLYTRAGQNGFAVWYTPPARRRLLFTKSLGLKDGMYSVPAMIWKADREELSIYALKQSDKPSLSTQLFHAPFFNIHDGGNVCMGTVDIEIDRDTRLESFIKQWEDYFFGSKFSHTLGVRAPVKGNIIQLWESLYDNRKKFPTGSLQKHQLTINKLIA